MKVMMTRVKRSKRSKEFFERIDSFTIVIAIKFS